MLLGILGVIVSYIPAVILYFYLRNLRREDAGYRSSCRRLLVRGILCSLAVALLALVVNILWGISGVGQDMPLLKAAIRTFVLAACIEELVKFHVTDKRIRKDRESVSWLSCIAYGAIVGIGFQMIETVVYLLESNVIQILVRGFTMGHPSYGMLMGYFLGKALYTGKRCDRALAFVLPFTLHGLYDFSLADEFQALNDNLVFVPFILIFIELFVLIRFLFLIKKEKKGTKYTKILSQSSELPAGEVPA